MRSFGQVDCWGVTPLHAACKNNAPFEVLEFLVNQAPSFAQCCIGEQLSSFPLNLLMSKGDCEFRSFKLLVETYPGILEDSNCKVPIIFDLLRRKMNESLIEFLITKYPSICQQQYRQLVKDYRYAYHDFTVLEFALSMKYLSINVLQTIVSAYPTAIESHQVCH